MGMNKCKLHSRDDQGKLKTEGKVAKCATCTKYKGNKQNDLLKRHELPDWLWAKVGSDIFQFGDNDYVVIGDYNTKYPETLKLTNRKSGEIIIKLKECYARHSIPNIMVADNMPYASSKMVNLSNE